MHIFFLKSEIGIHLIYLVTLVHVCVLRALVYLRRSCAVCQSQRREYLVERPLLLVIYGEQWVYNLLRLHGGVNLQITQIFIVQLLVNLLDHSHQSRSRVHLGQEKRVE